MSPRTTSLCARAVGVSRADRDTEAVHAQGAVFKVILESVSGMLLDVTPQANCSGCVER